MPDIDKNQYFKETGRFLLKNCLHNKTIQPQKGAASLFLFILICLTLILIIYSEDQIRKSNIGESNFKRNYEVEARNLFTLSAILNYYKEKTGKYPSNDEQLMQIPIFKEIAGIKQGIYYLDNKFKLDMPDTYKEFNKILGENNTYNYKMPISVSSDGILSPYAIPYILENRTGTAENNFNFSPLNNKNLKSEKYSLKVSENVYIYSPSALYYAYQDLQLEEKINNQKQQFLTLRNNSIVIMIILTVLFFIKYGFSSLKKNFASMAELLISCATIGIIAAITVPQAITHCYRPAPFKLPQRDKNTVDLCSELLEKYKQNNIISEAAYQKLKNSLTKEIEK